MKIKPNIKFQNQCYQRGTFQNNQLLGNQSKSIIFLTTDIDCNQYSILREVRSFHINEHDVPWLGARTKRPVSTVKPVGHCQRQQQLETAERGHSRKEISHQRTFASLLYFLADVPRSVDWVILITFVVMSTHRPFKTGLSEGRSTSCHTPILRMKSTSSFRALTTFSGSNSRPEIKCRRRIPQDKLQRILALHIPPVFVHSFLFRALRHIRIHRGDFLLKN